MSLYEYIYDASFLPYSQDVFYADPIIVDDAPRCDDPWNNALWKL